MTEKQIKKWLGEDSTGGLAIQMAWKDAASAGNKAIETPEGEQFMIIHDGLVMSSKVSILGYGWDVEVVYEATFRERHHLKGTLPPTYISKWKLVTPRVLE